MINRAFECHRALDSGLRRNDGPNRVTPMSLRGVHAVAIPLPDDGCYPDKIAALRSQ